MLLNKFRVYGKFDRINLMTNYCTNNLNFSTHLILIDKILYAKKITVKTFKLTFKGTLV